MKSVEPTIAVVIATRNRAKQLKRTLLSLQEQLLGQMVPDVIVVDNGSTDDTAAVLTDEWPGLNLLSLYEGSVGKSKALNRALSVVRNELVAFTDDDVTAAPTWLADIVQASARYPTAAVFCGPIIPCFPAEIPQWVRTHSKSGAFFGQFEPQDYEGPLAGEITPFGANFAVRQFALRDIRFRDWLGPSLEHGPLFGEDTEFVRRIRSRYEQCVFLPSAKIFHHIMVPTIELDWIFERAFHFGRSIILLYGRPAVLDPPYALEDGTDEQRRSEQGGVLNYYYGQLCQLRISGRTNADFEAQLHHALEGLQIDPYQTTLLGKSARQFLLTHTRIKVGEQ